MRSSGMSDLEECLKRAYPEVKSDDSDTEARTHLLKCYKDEHTLLSSGNHHNRTVVSHTEWEKSTETIRNKNQNEKSEKSEKGNQKNLSSSKNDISSNTTASAKPEKGNNKSPKKPMSGNSTKEKDVKDKEKEKVPSTEIGKKTSLKDSGKSSGKDNVDTKVAKDKELEKTKKKLKKANKRQRKRKG